MGITEQSKTFYEEEADLLKRGMILIFARQSNFLLALCASFMCKKQSVRCTSEILCRGKSSVVFVVSGTGRFQMAQYPNL